MSPLQTVLTHKLLEPVLSHLVFLPQWDCR
jgi:hypothetical protein